MPYSYGYVKENGINLHYVSTTAKDISLRSLSDVSHKAGQNVWASDSTSMNASFFMKQANGYCYLNNIAINNGVSVGGVNGGTENRTGNCVAYYTKAGVIKYKTGVISATGEILTATWAQGGAGLYLQDADSAFLTNIKKEPEIGYNILNIAHSRTALIVGTALNTSPLAILVMTQELVYPEDFRYAIKALLKDLAETTVGWEALLLDGGSSSQMYIKNRNLKIQTHEIGGARVVPQCICVS